MKFRPKIAQHDYDVKKGRVERFLKAKSKVKITIMFRGREVTHPERGRAILNRLAEELAEVGVVEQHPTQDGRNMTMMLGPSKAALAGRADHVDAEPDAPAPDAALVGDVAQVAETTQAAEAAAEAAEEAAEAAEAPTAALADEPPVAAEAPAAPDPASPEAEEPAVPASVDESATPAAAEA